MIKRFMAVLSAAALAVALVPAAAFAADSSAAAATNSYQVYAFREAQYGTPPNGDTSDEGMSFIIDVDYGAAVTVSDATAAVTSINTKDAVLLNGSAIATLPKATVEANGTRLLIKVPVAMAIMAGVLKTAQTPISGVTAGGQAVELPAINTQICTGLRFHVSSMTIGTATTPASTTVTIDQSAVVRSMNHVLWTSNGSSILDGVGNTQSTPAHHHSFFSFKLSDSASSIVTNATSKEALTAGYDITAKDDTVTITAKTAKAGEYLGIYNYDDAFLQGAGKSFSDHITGLTQPVVGQWAASAKGESYTYTGKAIKGDAVVSICALNYATYSMTEGTDYTISYSGSTTKAGKVTATITGKGIYKGSQTVTYKIAPTKGKITSLKAGKKSFTAKWSNTGATKFKVSYKVKSASKWSTKTFTKRSATVKGLKSGKTYQVKVTSVTTAGNTTTAVKTVKVK